MCGHGTNGKSPNSLAFPEEIRCHIDTWYDPDIHFDTQERLRMALLSILERRGHIEVLP